jgi:5-deoxy-glucuronate isomerase
MASGRIRMQIGNGWTQLVDSEMQNTKMGTISLGSGESFTLDTGEREYACVLVYGHCSAVLLGEEKSGVLGPRKNPFDDKPFGFFVTREEKVTFTALEKTLIGVASAPAAKKTKNTLVTPEKVGGGMRGVGNWEREVRFVCWSDNTEGNMLMAGETVTPSGNWSTIPPHRHQYDIAGEEVPYEEIYFFQFSKPQGYGLAWQFDDDGKMDQAFSLKTNDALYMDQGYHPTACGPGATLYHLTFIVGPYRISKSAVHKDFQFLLEENNMENPYARQLVGKK